MADTVTAGMGFAGLLLVVLAAMLSAALVVWLMLRVTPRGGASAVAELQSSRLDQAEAALEVERRARSAAEAGCAAARQEAGGAALALSALQDRLLRAEAALAEGQVAAAGLHEARASAEQALAGHRERLVAADAKHADLLERHRTLLAEREAAGAQLRDLAAERAGLRETLQQERRQAAERLETVLQARREMTDRFGEMANEVMFRHGEAFTRLNREQIDAVLLPLRERLGTFEQAVQASHVESARDRAALGEQIRGLGRLGEGMQSSTNELAAALRGRSQTQGAWGELVLARVLEQSGLRVGHEYEVQQSFTTDEGRLRPDVIVTLPDKQRIVVDAKVSLTAFEVLVNGATEEERADGRRRHLASVRGHITTLGSKQYHDLVGGTLDYVMMFVPIEGALAAAVEADRELIPFASSRNVVIATPTTLMVALRTIAAVWQVERRNLNAEEIARRAGLLYDKFVGFLDDMAGIDAALHSTRRAYEKAFGKLGAGKGNLVRQAELLRELGARVSKPIPPALLEAAEDGPEAASAGEDAIV